jgi:uncharacterized protein (TIGR02118 family)
MSTVHPTAVAETSAPASGAQRATAGAQLIVLYSTPADLAAFDAYYSSTHAPLAKKLPGLRKYLVSNGGVTTPGADTPPHHLLAELHFDSIDALKAALASPEGAAAVADLPNFASAGVSISIVEVTDIL